MITCKHYDEKICNVDSCNKRCVYYPHNIPLAAPMGGTGESSSCCSSYESMCINEGRCKFNYNTICPASKTCTEQNYASCGNRVIYASKLAEQEKQKFLDSAKNMPAGKIQLLEPVETLDKPTLGARLKYIYIEHRVTELCEAIARANNHSVRVEWCSELGEWLRMLEGATK
jgi:hypothetical protein